MEQCQKISTVTLDDFERKRACIQDEIEQLGGAIDGVTGIGDEDFPVISPRVEKNRPTVLFYRGDISLIRQVKDNVAVIGLLDPTEPIISDERAVVQDLVDQGKCILSGLARGCDAIAHRTTLDCGGKTVAFLPSPLNQINPPVNRSLANEIVANGGLLISEYFREVPPGRGEFTRRYVERDRLQAMFAEAVVLAGSYSEADSRQDSSKDSGSRHAMGKATEYKVPRYVIYDETRDAMNPMFNLSREEIEKGAEVIRPGGPVELSAIVDDSDHDQQLELEL